MLQSRIQKFTRFFQHRIAADSSPVHHPLVDGSALDELALYANSLPWSLLAFERQAAHPLIGETLSFHRGSGMEFEDNRIYQPGDAPRLLNWRLYARTGNLYSKVFTEERRPQVFLLVDRRAMMRFGTRRQLKVTLAVKIAACYAYQAQQQAMPVGGLILNDSMDWFAPGMGEIPLQSLVQSLVTACPPQPFEKDQPDFIEALGLMIHRLPAGCFVLLVSDFADLDADTAAPLLHQLAARHTLRAVQILDPVEQQLPSSGDFLIEDNDSDQPLRIQGLDQQQHAAYAKSFKESQQKLANGFKGCGIPLKTCSTQDDLEICLQPFEISHGTG